MAKPKNADAGKQFNLVKWKKLTHTHTQNGNSCYKSLQLRSSRRFQLHNTHSSNKLIRRRSPRDCFLIDCKFSVERKKVSPRLVWYFLWLFFLSVMHLFSVINDFDLWLCVCVCGFFICYEQLFSCSLFQLEVGWLLLFFLFVYNFYVLIPHEQFNSANLFVRRQHSQQRSISQTLLEALLIFALNVLFFFCLPLIKIN